MVNEGTANVYKAFVIPLVAHFEKDVQNHAIRSSAITKFKADMTRFAGELVGQPASPEFMQKVKTATQLALGIDENNYKERIKQIKDTLGLK
jgi:hypothetical protein